MEDFEYQKLLKKIVTVAAMRHRQPLTKTRSQATFFAGELKKYENCMIESITVTPMGSIQVIMEHPKSLSQSR